MKMYKPLAAFAAASLCLTGLSVGAAAAVADDSARSSYVPLKAFKKATNAEHEHDVYNVWHFDPDHNNIASLSSARNGIVFGAGANVLAMKGNGLDQEGATSSSKTDILDLAKSLKIVASSTQGLTFQVPVFYDKAGGGTGYTALYKSASASDDDWHSTSTIPGYEGKNGSLEDLTDALEENENARPIGAGFLSQGSAQSAVISSFTAGDELTKFYAQPSTAAVGQASSEYLSDGYIRENEDTYPGWHEGAEVGGSYETVAGENVGETLGLKVVGKAQILNGLDEQGFLANAASRAADMRIDAQGQVWAQIAVFAYPEGASGPVFSTLRAEVPANGKLSDATVWQSSKAIPGANGTTAIAKDGDYSLSAIVAALGDHDVIGYGAFVDTDKTATIRSISFDGKTTNFAKSFSPSKKDVLVSEVVNATNGTEEHESYNVWHFDPDHQGTAVTQVLEGMAIPANGNVLALKGNGNDAAGTVSQDAHDISDLAASLAIDVNSAAGVTFQVPVRWNGGWTTLRKPVDANDGQWTTSKAINGTFGANSTGSLEDLTEAIESNGNAYAIGAGFLVQGNAAKTVVKSFTAAGETTSFAAQPEATTVGFAVKLSYNTAGSADITVSAAGTEKPTGSVKLTIAGKSYTGALNGGKARIALGGLIAAGRYTAKVEYTSDNALEFQNSSITSTVSVAKATPAVALKLSKSKVKTSQKATGAVSVSIPGALKASAKGLKVTVYDGKKKVATATLNSSGKASVKLPKLKKGTHKIKVTVTSTSNTNEKTSSTKTLKVTK